MFGRGMHLSVFYCLCYVKEMSTGFSEKQVFKERDTDLNEEEDIRMDEIRENPWRYITEEGGNKKRIHDLRWGVYVKEKEDFTKRKFWCLFRI